MHRTARNRNRLVERTGILLGMTVFLACGEASFAQYQNTVPLPGSNLSPLPPSQLPQTPQPLYSTGIPAPQYPTYPVQNPGSGGLVLPSKDPMLPGDSPAIRALIQDEIKKSDADKKKAADEKKAQDDAKKAADDAAKKAADEAKGTEVVNNVPITVNWNNSLWFEGADKAFRIRIGAYAQYDMTNWIQPQGTIPPVAGGNVSEGIYENGIFVRRMRVELEGTIWEQFEFQTYPEFDAPNRIQFDEMWFGAKDIPFIGSLRFGKDKIPQGMESIGSSKDVWFMERSVVFDSFLSEFGMGVFQTRTFLNDRAGMMTWAGKWDITEFAFNEGYNFDNGGWAVAERLWALPIYESDGRYLLHMGVSYQWRQANSDRSLNAIIPAPPAASQGLAFTPTMANSGLRLVRFRTRPDLRNAVGIGDLTNNQGGDALGFAEGNNTRLVDTGLLAADAVNTIATEIYGVWGRFSILNECNMNYVVNSATAASQTQAANVQLGNQFFWGTSTQVSCFLTGENRTYNQRYGTYGRVIPNTNTWLLRDENGNFNGGLGAWEVLFRYDYVNENVLNNSGAAIVNAPAGTGVVTGSGLANSYTFGLNWHLNPNMRVMFNYTIFDRYINPTGTGITAATAGAASPTQHDVTQGFGARFHLQF